MIPASTRELFRQSPWSYALAVAVPVAVMLIFRVAGAFLDRLPSPPMLAAILAVAWYCGRRPALVATSISIVLLHIYVLKRGQPYQPDVPDVVGLALFGGLAVFLSYAAPRLGQTLRELQRERQREYAARAEAERHSREADELRGLSRALTYTTSPTAAAQRVTDAVKRLFDPSSSVVRLLEPDGAMVAVAVAGESAVVVPGHRMPAGSGVVGLAVTERRMVVTSSVLTDPRVSLPPPVREQHARLPHRLVIAVPLIVDDVVIGTLALNETKTRTFSENELALLQTLANHAAVGIRNAQLFQQERTAREEAEELARLAGSLTESLDRSEVADRIVQTVRSLFGARSAVLRLLESDGSLISIAVAGSAPALPEPRHFSSPGEDAAGGTAAEGGPVWTSTVLRERNTLLTEDVRRRLAGMDDRSSLAAPLTVEGHLMGVLSLTDHPSRTFSEPEVKLFQALADQAALAIRNAQLFAREQAARASAEQAAQALLWSETRYRTLVNDVPIALYRYTAEGEILDVNPAMVQMLGYPDAQKLLGVNALGLYVDPEESHAIEVRPGSESSTQVAEARWRRFDGTTIWVRMRVHAVPDVAGRTLYYEGAAEDITERTQAETALRDTNQTLRALVEGSPLAIWVLDPNGRVKMWNPAAERLFGWTPREVIGQLLPLTPEDQEAESRLLREQALHGNALTGLEVRRTRKDGSMIDMTLSLAPLRDAGGRVTDVIAIGADITERTQLEEQLRQSQKMEAIGRLAGGVAHDFNNLLTVILGRTAVVLEQLGAGNPLQRSLDIINQAAKRAAALTQQLLTFSRKQALELKILDPRSLVAGMEPMLRRLIREDVNLVIPTSAAVGYVKADQSQLEQVIMNLVVNALDALPHGGTITIGLSNIQVNEPVAAEPAGVRPGPYVRLEVSDTGLGMSPETQRRCFEPFFTTKGIGQGTGLGLAIVYGIVARHGGSIAVESALGRGSTFGVYLPRVDGAADVGEHRGGREPASCSGTVLLVEDEESVRDLAAEILRSHGYTVLEAASAAEALRICKDSNVRIDLLLTDVIMPEMGGCELADRVSQLRPDMRVLYMSGYTADIIAQHGIPDSGIAVLQKPFSPAVLAETVREMLDRVRTT